MGWTSRQTFFKALQRDNEVGRRTRPIDVSLHGNYRKCTREEKTEILVIRAKGGSLTTGYGDQMVSYRVVSTYQSVNQNKVFESFGLRYFQINGKIPRKRPRQMVYSNPRGSSN